MSKFGFGIPYMGSKSRIVASLVMNLPAADYFYDLFGGGFAVSHYVLAKKSKRYKYVHYNEIKTDVTELVQKAMNGGFNYGRFIPKWISREDFAEYKDTDAYIRCLWSFGNNQNDYLFGTDIEKYKRSMHMAIVFNEFNNISFSVLGFKEWPNNVDTITKRRCYLGQKVEWLRVKNKIPKILTPFFPEKKADNLKQLQQLAQLERLERLQQLEQLEQLEQLRQLIITSKDYREVEILPNAIVYCDIPYQGTCGYGEFNHKEFFDWAATRIYPVYISEYNISDQRFKLIYSIDNRALLTTNGDSNKIKSENLYWNGVVNA